MWSKSERRRARCAQLPAFPELLAEIEAAIAELGGRVLPKLNWSAPTDATWLTTCGSVACTNAEEVLPETRPA